MAQAAAAEVERTIQYAVPLQGPVVDLELPLRIGYISHDMGDHPTGHLWQGLPSLHSSRVAVKLYVPQALSAVSFCNNLTMYALNAGEDTPYWRRLQKSKWPLQSFTGVSYRCVRACARVSVR